MKRFIKYLSTLIAIALVAVLTVGIIGPVKAQAASKKTVRVVTQKELNKALKKSNVGTVILRTQTYDSITISSKKAKKKNIIIDAPYANIENKSKFKSIEVKNAGKYIENCSGNTISVNYTDHFIIAEGKNVKKLTVTTLSTNYVIRKGASIGTITYKGEGLTSSVDKKTGVLTVKNSWEDGNSIEYQMTLDADGRIVYLSYNDYEGTMFITVAEYDDNGNMLEVREINADTNELSFKQTYEYDKDNNPVKYVLDSNDLLQTYSYEYNSKGYVTAYYSYSSDSGEYLFEYTYDKNGRNVETKGEVETLYYSYRYTEKTTYDKKGYMLKSVKDYDDGVQVIDTYEYDKDGNNTYYCNEQITVDGESSKYEYKYEYDKLGDMTDAYIKMPGDSEWYNFDDIGD